MPPDVLLIGCGYLGERIAGRFTAVGRTVAALTRSPQRADAFRSRGWHPVIGDLLDPHITLPSTALTVWAAAPDRGQSAHSFYVDGMANLLRSVTGRLIVVSSTGVYGQSGGELVDESAATEPTDASGQAVLDMERLVGHRGVILRFAGIYGPGRWLRADALIAGQPFGGDPDAWLNLIHGDDGADAVVTAERAADGSVYNVSDGQPVRRGDFFTELARRLGAAPPVFAGPAMRGGNRRIDSKRFAADLNWRPRYPSYRDGLAAAAR